MKKGNVRKIDLSRKRIARLADKYYNEGDYVSALRLAYRELRAYGGDPDVYARFADIYEGMGLQGSAINSYFRFLDVAEEEDLPDIYEGLAANYLSLGNESASAYYYNKLIDADETIPEDVKLDIAEVFSSKKRDGFRFVYPPRMADYSEELNLGSRALKAGDCRRAIAEFSKIEKGSKEYESAKEMQAVAYLLAGDAKASEEACLELLAQCPNSVRVKATLAAVYLEQKRTDESREIAKELSALELTDTDDLYKVATVCCENGLHDEAYKKFVLLDKKAPYDGRTLYFKAVSAYLSGRVDEAERTLDRLCTIYPDAEVGKYYLKAIRAYKEEKESETGEDVVPPELIYFYHLPQEEREHRCASMLKIGSCSKDEARIFGLLALHDGYFHWCFDEMDGGDHDLQYLGLVTAAHVHADEFLQEILLDFEVADVLKVETLRMLIERNEAMDVGLVLCNIYRRVPVYKIKIGKKRHAKFIEAYAKIASKFIVIKDSYAEDIAMAAERLYRALEKENALDLIDNSDDCACAIFLCAKIKEMGNDAARICSAFDANLAKVQVLLSYVLPARKQSEKNEKNEETADETH